MKCPASLLSDRIVVRITGTTRPIASKISAGSMNRNACQRSRPRLGALSIGSGSRPITARKTATARTAPKSFEPALMSPLVEYTSDGRGVTIDPPAIRWRLRRSSYLGQDFSMLSSVVWSLCPVIHWVICFQNDPAPTELGIVSEASNRNTVLGSVSNWNDSLSMSLPRLSGFTPLFALSQPPPLPFVTSARLLAQSAVARYSCTAWTSGRSENAPTNSPPPSTGCGNCVLTGG